MSLPEFRVPRQPRPGWLPGAVLGVLAGLLLGAIWEYGAWDVALAVTAVFLGLVAAVGASPDGRKFGLGLLGGAVVAGALVVLLG